MAWEDYKTPTTLIPGAGEVRGLDLEDFGVLLAHHLDAMMDITTIYIAQQKDILATGNYTDLFLLIARQFPNLVSEVISIAADTPTLRDKRLPAGMQLTCLAAILKLTVQDAGGLGNLSAILQSAVKASVAGRGEVSRKIQDILSQSSTSGAEKTPTS